MVGIPMVQYTPRTLVKFQSTTLPGCFCSGSPVAVCSLWPPASNGSKALVARHRFALWLSWIQHDRKQCQNKKTMGSPKGELLKQTNQGSYDRQQIQVLEKLLDIVG